MNPSTVPAIPAARHVSPLARALTQAKVAGIPQWAIALEADISPALLSGIARGRIPVTDEVAKRIAAALGCDRSELFPER